MAKKRTNTAKKATGAPSTKRKTTKPKTEKTASKKKVAKKKPAKSAAKKNPPAKKKAASNKKQTVKKKTRTRKSAKKTPKKPITAKKTKKQSAAGRRPSAKRKTLTRKNALTSTVDSIVKTESNDAVGAAYARAKRAYRKYFDHLRALPGVKALSVGARFKDDKPSDQFAIRLHMQSEKDKQALKSNPDAFGLQAEYDGVPSDIVVWTFRTASDENELPDGTCIRGGGGNGTLGTKVFLREDGIRTGVWLTAAHVVSSPKTRPTAPVDMSLCSTGNLIGIVSPDHYFRSDKLDSALVVPDSPLNVDPIPRVIRDVRQKNIGSHAALKGARNQSVGIIDSLDYDGPVEGPGGFEQVTDHFLVRRDGGTFAESGDSGGVVTLGKEFGPILIGQIRAVDDNTGIAVVTRLSVVRARIKFKL